MDLRIATPCHADWSAMSPAVAGRHCARCDKTVVDLTAAPAGGAAAAFAGVRRRIAAGEKVCVRAHSDAHGRLAPVRARRRLLTNGVAAVLAVTIAGALAGRATAAEAGESGDGPAQPTMTAPATEPAPIVTGAAIASVPNGAPRIHPVMGKVAATTLPGPTTPRSTSQGEVAPVVPPDPAEGRTPGCFAPGWHHERPDATVMGDVARPIDAPAPVPSR